MNIQEKMDEEDNNTEAPSVDVAASSNINSNEIDEETANRLRGDAIGDTMYSEVFVLNMLMQFSDLKWSPEVEENLCFLWDMTEEKDVCQYLFQVSYPSLACTAITNYNEPRFIEIVVGIFANILCSKCEKNLKENEIKTVLDLLNSNNPYILIQVMRFIHAISFMYEHLPFISEDHADKINFILCNSTNKELLVHTLKIISPITDDTKLNENVVKGELLLSAITAYRLIKEEVDCELEFEVFDSQEQHQIIKHIIQFVCNVCSYIDNFNVVRIINEVGLGLDAFSREMSNLLNYFTLEKNLLPIDDDFKFYMEALTYIYKIFNVKCIDVIFIPLCKILLLLNGKNESLEVVNELFCYFISVGKVESLKKDLKNLPIAETKNMLKEVEKIACRYEFNYMTNLKVILNDL